MQSRKQRKPLMIRVLTQYLGKRSARPIVDQPKIRSVQKPGSPRR